MIKTTDHWTKWTKQTMQKTHNKWQNFIAYALTYGVIVRPAAHGKYDMWHENDTGYLHSVDTLDEAVISLEELIKENK